MKTSHKKNMMPKFDDVDVVKKEKRKSPGNSMKDNNKVNSHLDALAPIPESAKDNPIGWAGEQ